MSYGFTTGSCAAAAAKAAAYMLLTGKPKTDIRIETPKGITYHAKLHAIVRTERNVSCAVKKDGGVDPDVTTGTLIYASVRIQREDNGKAGPSVRIEGGVGVGRVTRPGLEQPVGSAAINRVPREMMQKEVLEVADVLDFKGTLTVVIAVPGGAALAQKTFNPRLGIKGGISILGTTGIVEPMSSQALLATIRAELSVRRAEGLDMVAVTPGNYGQDFMRRTYGYELEESVKCSNFIGDTLDMAASLGMKAILLTGHIGKLVKLSGGMMNTHSREGDCRMELMAAAGLRAGLPSDTLCRILDCVTTDEAVSVISDAGYLSQTSGIIMEHIIMHLQKRAAGKLQTECILYSNETGALAKSDGAEQLLRKIMCQRTSENQN